MAIEIPSTAYGKAVLADESQLTEIPMLADNGTNLLTDRSIELLVNVNGSTRYTHPNLHRRVETEPEYTPGVHYPLVVYDASGTPYPQSVVLGVWDGMKSYRTTETYVHDEESETTEIP